MKLVRIIDYRSGVQDTDILVRSARLCFGNGDTSTGQAGASVVCKKPWLSVATNHMRIKCSPKAWKKPSLRALFTLGVAPFDGPMKPQDCSVNFAH